MDFSRQAALLRIYTEEARRDGARSLRESIIVKARDAGLAGATVLRGPMGFGESARIHNANILDLSGNLPPEIEIVDAVDKLRAFAAAIGGVKDIGPVTLVKVEALHCGHRSSG